MAADDATRGSFITGWKSDFGPATAAIEIEEVRFTGGPAFRENGSVYLPHPSSVDYGGYPSPEIDEAWKSLIRHRYFIMTKEEARNTWPDEWAQTLIQLPTGDEGYLGGIDMFHTLHCLDQLRHMIWSEYYNEPVANNPHTNLMHKGHCIDQIRQYIMCAGDLTPIPVKSYRGIDGSPFRYVDSDYPHTCRSFGKIREWADARSDRILESIQAH
ncbi:hypothetical protein NA57DRAFT_80104 [Rhizodiscina lignyota]|uniref:Cyclochlorotine biosynthesis protein O n=1 Tax=Rhizodiscina lignyota TaxID=1504668 RepID=A0A9P4IAE3_9PEZI|nr:hypothetical protein NA57DRAFT_80104 [Rhizodiscina lignyota]